MNVAVLFKKDALHAFSRSRSTGVGAPGGADRSSSVMRPLPLMAPIICARAHGTAQTTEAGTQRGEASVEELPCNGIFVPASQNALGPSWVQESVQSTCMRCAGPRQPAEPLLWCKASCLRGVKQQHQSLKRHTCRPHRSRPATASSRARSLGSMSRQSFS